MQEIPLVDDVTYNVKINRVVVRGIMKHLPRDKHRFTGAALRQVIADYGWEVIDDCAVA